MRCIELTNISLVAMNNIEIAHGTVEREKKINVKFMQLPVRCLAIVDFS